MQPMGTCTWVTLSLFLAAQGGIAEVQESFVWRALECPDRSSCQRQLSVLLGAVESPPETVFQPLRGKMTGVPDSFPLSCLGGKW